MREAIIVLFAILVISTSVNAQSTSYVGYKYKGVTPSSKLPNGVVHNGGGLIGDINAEVVHGVSMVQKGTTKMYWLEASTGQDATGVTGWEVLDVLVLPRVTKTDYVFFIDDPAVECSRRGAVIPNLLGVGRVISRTSGSFRPSKLWVANLKTKKFVPMSPAGVKCIYSEP
jgi:hypothetical protein